jgi:hypothetical protein
MGFVILDKLRKKIWKFLGWKTDPESDIKNQDPLSSSNFASNHVNGFNISETAERLNQSDKFQCIQLKKDKDEESWVFETKQKLEGYDQPIEINVNIHFDDGLLIFLMPMFGNGSKGLIGDNLYAYDALIHIYNSRIKGGYFTKYTYDASFTLVFMNTLPLGRMDSDWFISILDHFINVFKKFRPLFSLCRSRLGLDFSDNAVSADSALKFLKKEREEQDSLGGDMLDIMR